MNDKKFYEDFQKKDWNYLMIEGSLIGNSSFLLSFVENIVFGEDDFKFSEVNKLLGESKSILFLRTEPFLQTDKKSLSIINSISKIATFEPVYLEEAFEYRNIIRLLQNRYYSHLILDDVRKKYDEKEDERLNKFSEILSLCQESGIQVISSLTENKLKKMDYQYSKADILLKVSHDIIQNLYFIDVEDKKNLSLKKYSLPIK